MKLTRRHNFQQIEDSSLSSLGAETAIHVRDKAINVASSGKFNSILIFSVQFNLIKPILR
jgi:hypothetical protein